MADEIKSILSALNPVGGVIGGAADMGGANAATPNTPPAVPDAAPAPVVQEDADVATLVEALSRGEERVTWDDGGKALFKKTFGVEDPYGFKEEFEKMSGRVKALEASEAEAAGLKGLLDRIEKEHPVLAAAIMEASGGKDPLAYIDAIPERKLVGRASKDISTEVLVNTYLRDKFSEAEREAMRSGDFDTLNVSKEDLKAKYELFRPVAEHLHNERNSSHFNRISQQEKSAKEHRERMEASVNDSIAYASRDPYVRSFLTKEMIASAKQGELIDKSVYNQDGTLRDSAIALIVKGQRYDADIKRVYEAGKKAGNQSRTLEEVHKMPSTSQALRSGQAPEQQQQQQRGNNPLGDLMSVFSRK